MDSFILFCYLRHSVKAGHYRGLLTFIKQLYGHNENHKTNAFPQALWDVAFKVFSYSMYPFIYSLLGGRLIAYNSSSNILIMGKQMMCLRLSDELGVSMCLYPLTRTFTHPFYKILINESHYLRRVLCWV